MLLSTSIARIRRILRDANATVFSDSTIIRIWEEVQQRFAMQTGLLEALVDLAVPPLAHATYTHNWEEDFSAKPSNLIYNFMSSYTYSQPWEPSASIGESPATSGGFTGTQQWEVLYADIQNRIRHYFPDDFIEAIYIAYDQKPVDWIYRQEISGVDSSFKTWSGMRPSIYVDDRESKTFFLFPRVEADGVTVVNGEFGEIVYDDTSSFNPNSDYGVVVFGDEMNQDFGLVSYVQEAENAIHLIYKRAPVALSQTNQRLEWPRFVAKYIEAGVLAKLFSMETDLADPVLAQHFQDRYDRGLKLMALLRSKKRIARTYRLESSQAGRGRRKLADLPSAYPSYWR